MSERKMASSILSGFCPDKKCRSKLFFPNFDMYVECNHCGQQHDRNSIQGVQEVSHLDSHFDAMLRNILMSNIIPKRGTETVKVLGLSNFHCKLLSPLLTKYGMDKRTGKAKLLSDMNQGDIFDCGLFGDRAFLIDPEHISVPGFGRDMTGSFSYLSRTLDLIKHVNDDDERLIPIHADGDGHCLVHAVSRALVGRELFWHPLRCSLKKHFQDNLRTYKDLFKDFIDECEWGFIIDECDPDFIPPDGELLGLRNIHVFGLANVLKRPIILLDSFECMNSLGDYAALFLPSLISPVLCRGRDNHLNKPLCIAWSNSGHNHYIPLVGIKKKPLPILPVGFLPKAWGVPQSQILTYMEFDESNNCTIGGDRNLGDPYILRLVSAMEELFLEQYGVHPGLVADVHHYLYQNTGMVSVDRNEIVLKTKKAIEEGRLYRCLNCDAVCEQVIKAQWFHCGGVLYNMALVQHGTFVHNQLYPFPLHGIVCRYDAQCNELVPDLAQSALDSCTWCNGNTVRKVNADGGILYWNGDKTKTPSNASLCGCGFKHYWDGKEYDNPSQKLNVVLEWNNQVVNDTVLWFEKESDPSLNSNVYQVASEVVQKHFPGEFGSERLVQRVVEQVLIQTKPSKAAYPLQVDLPKPADSFPEASPTNNKIFISGTGVLHKEELGLSETENQILQNVQQKAEINQTKHSQETGELFPSVDTKESEFEEKIKDPPAPKEIQESDKFVRVVTSDGRQGKLMLHLDGLNYKQLQDWIQEEFKIAPSKQRLKYGFPPQEMQIDSFEASLKLSHGDRLIVEIIPSEDELPSPGRSDTLPSGLVAEKSFLDFSAFQNLNSQLIWTFVKSLPSLFKQGGLFYTKLASDQPLIDKKHCTLALLPNKIFSYDASSDSFKLCEEPFGHFAIEEDMDAMIESVRQSGFSPSPCNLTQKEASLPSGSSSQRQEEDSSLFPRNLIRKGPGFSVLSALEFSPETQVSMLQSLANQLTANNCSEKGSVGTASSSSHKHSETFVPHRRKMDSPMTTHKLSEGGNKAIKRRNSLSRARLASDSDCDNSDMETDSA